MSEPTSVLVLGMDERASAVAHKLRRGGFTVALHQDRPPTTIRRNMAFADAWFETSVMLDGVEARRWDGGEDLFATARAGSFIPVLQCDLDQVLETWPFDAVVDARPPAGPPRENLRDVVKLSIGLGPGFVAGETCDIAIEVEGPDPGAILRSGRPKAPSPGDVTGFADGRCVHAPRGGLFNSSRRIGDVVAAGHVVGWIGAVALEAPRAGRLRGLARPGALLAKHAEAAEVIAAPGGPIGGMSKRDRLVARSVAFVVEMERGGWAPISLQSFF